MAGMAVYGWFWWSVARQSKAGEVVRGPFLRGSVWMGVFGFALAGKFRSVLFCLGKARNG